MRKTANIFYINPNFLHIKVLYIKGAVILMIKKPNIPSEASLLTVTETAELLNLTANSLYHWNCKEFFPQLRRVKIGGRVYFTAASVVSLLK